ncbi:MAG: SDR family NAD(P)-dependent oxidoreductase [Pseudomonadota bacterium]
MRKLAGKSAIVTGSGRGIGQAIAIKLASEGARVVVNDLDAEKAEISATSIRDQGGEAIVVAGDVAADGFAENLIDTTLDTLGSIDIIVNNAGYIWNSAIHNHSDDQWDAMLAVHATAPFKILRAAAPYFRETAKKADGPLPYRKVVNISSVSGTQGSATQIAYSAGKAAVVGITKTLAKEWGQHYVTVNCVAFGLIQTRLTQAFEEDIPTIEVKGQNYRVGISANAIEANRRTSSLRRNGQPEDGAGAVYLFCIPESDYVTGEVLTCSGGL